MLDIYDLLGAIFVSHIGMLKTMLEDSHKEWCSPLFWILVAFKDVLNLGRCLSNSLAKFGLNFLIANWYVGGFDNFVGYLFWLRSLMQSFLELGWWFKT
jgi:hypothetical protein